MNNELKWIRSITPTKHNQKQLKVGIGDDAAIYHQEDAVDTVIAVDTMVEGVHFKKETMPLSSIGYKALAVNISDLAAMGAIPLYYLVSIAIPKNDWTIDQLQEIYKGMERHANIYKMDLIGGDTVSIEKNLVLTVTVVGKVEKDRQLLRSVAKPGDILFVTGQLGLSAYGLERLLSKGLTAIEDESLTPYIQAHQEPIPQVKAGRLLAQSGFRIALDDVSDGLASEAKEIAEASEVNIEIDWASIPMTDKMKTEQMDKQESWILYGGEDYQLLGTIAKENWQEIQTLFTKESIPLYPIGVVKEGKGNVVVKRNGEIISIKKTGYDHL